MGLVLAAALPAAAAAAVGFGRTHASTFRADAVGWSACVAIAAFGPAGGLAAIVAIVAAPLLLAGAHAVAGGAPSSALLLGAVCAACAASAAGLRSLGRTVGCPEPAAGAVAALVLALAGSGVWWVDRVAEGLPPRVSGTVRQAVVRADPVTAIAYDVAGYERLHAQDVYEGTVVATTPVVPPEAGTVALAYGAFGSLAIAGAAAARRRPGRRPGPVSRPAAAGETAP